MKKCYIARVELEIAVWAESPEEANRIAADNASDELMNLSYHDFSADVATYMPGGYDPDSLVYGAEGDMTLEDALNQTPEYVEMNKRHQERMGQIKAAQTQLVKPITPAEIVPQKQAQLPDEVLETFNELIAKHWNGHSSHFVQNLAIDAILSKMGLDASNRQKVFDEKWLEVEDIYRAAGWRVEYDAPAYCENYPATFKFSKKK